MSKWGVRKKIELSLQRRISLKTTFYLRQQMICKESLHIDEEISLEQFNKLYQKYSNGISKEEFARCFLDIDYKANYNLQKGYIKKTGILSREKVSFSEFPAIQKKILDFYPPNYLKEKADYDRIMEMYSQFGGKLSLTMFVEEILNISKHLFDCLNSNRTRKRKIFNPILFDRQEIEKIQNKVATQSGRHIKEQITLQEFEELYHQFGENIDKEIFATKVLQIQSSKASAFLREKVKKATIFSKYCMEPDDICKLREKVILEEGLHIEDPISKEEFQRLYQKYAGILSEELFAEEILDVTMNSVRNSKEFPILTKIEIPQEYIQEIRQKIIQENNFEQNDFITLEELEKLYKEHGYILSEKQFAVMILDTAEDLYQTLKRGEIEKTRILRNEKTTDFEELRTRVIRENNLHYNDEIDWTQFENLHKKYAPNVKDYIFAEKVLDILYDNFVKFKSPKDTKHESTRILLNEKLPSSEEIKKIKETVITENRLHRKDGINYQKLKEYHLKYGGIMSEEIFAEWILDIGYNSLLKIRPKENAKQDNKQENQKVPETQILLHTQMKKEEIENLRKRIIEENNLYVEKEISLEEFDKMYYGYVHILSKIEFAKEVFSINKDSLKKLQNRNVKTIKIWRQKRKEEKNNPNFTEEEVNLLEEYLIQGLSEEEIASKFFVSMHYLRENQAELLRSGKLSKQKILYERIKILIDEKQTLTQIRKLVDAKDEEITEMVKKIRTEKREEEKRIKQEERKKENKKRKSICQHGQLEKEAQRVLETYNYTESNSLKVTKYLENCLEVLSMEEQNEIKLDREKLDFLGECIQFVQGGMRYIEFFIKSCIDFREYEKARMFILNNINNKTVKEQEKTKLKNLQRSLEYAIRKEKATYMIYDMGINDVQQIVKNTGLLEVDVLRIRNQKNIEKEGKGEEKI